MEAIGVIPGSDMTVEAALMKLSYVLGKDDFSMQQKRKVSMVMTSWLLAIGWR
jgi:lysophospholipase